LQYYIKFRSTLLALYSERGFRTVNHCATYIAEAKSKLGNPTMTDRELGERIGYTQGNIARAKAGYMTDPMAVQLARVLELDTAEVVIVARAQREKDKTIRDAMLAYVGKAMPLLSARAVGDGGGRVVPTHASSGEVWRKR
jgi:hypothetical protein